MSRAKKKRVILVTGASGQIGSELTVELRRRYGRENVVAGWYKTRPHRELKTGPVEYIDVTRPTEIERTVRKYGVDTVYHLAALLSAVGEKDPDLAWRVNVGGLRHVLDIAKAEGIGRVFWPSSMAVFGPGIPREETPQDAPLVPTTMYGVTKVTGELLCNYYSRKYGMDIRSLRYPGIISSETMPGGGTTDYAVEVFYEAIRKKRYTFFVREDTVLPMMYMPDCVKSTVELMEAPESRVRVRMGYNVTGMSFSAGELASTIRERIPGFVCRYRPDFRQAIADSWPMSLDDSAARKDWGWRPDYDLASMADDMLAKLAKRLLPPRKGRTSGG